jgi:hypothetical protein
MKMQNFIYYYILNLFVQLYPKLALPVPKTPRNPILRPLLSTTAVKVHVIIIFDTNQSFHVRLAFRFFVYVRITGRGLNRQDIII